MKRRTPALIVLPSMPNELTGLECSDCKQLFLVDFSEYDEWVLMDEFGRHLRERHKGCSSFPPYEIRLAEARE